MELNEADTRAKHIDPKLRAAGWEDDDGSGLFNGVKVRREFGITEGRILGGGKRGKRQVADYVLDFKGLRLAVIEAKRFDLNYTEGVAQAVEYAKK